MFFVMCFDLFILKIEADALKEQHTNLKILQINMLLNFHTYGSGTVIDPVCRPQILSDFYTHGNVVG